MKKLLFLAALAALLLVTGCRLLESVTDHELRPEYVYRFPEKSHVRDFTDLRGEGEEYLLRAFTGDSYNSLILEDQPGRAISQINLAERMHGFRVLTEPKDQDRWLFVSANDGKVAGMMAFNYEWKARLGRAQKSFESIARTDTMVNRPDFVWYGHLVPWFIEDIDADGKREVVCSGYDGLTANPRGLICYDFESGKIKWRLELVTTLQSLLWEDFDGDGAKELVCGNIAHKNSTRMLQGLDDEHGYIIVVSPQGQILHREKVFDGFGSVMLVTDPADKDGQKEIYAVSTTWGNAKNLNSVRALRWNGRQLAEVNSWSFAGSLMQNRDITILNSLDRRGRKRILLAAKDHPLVALDENLNEVKSRFMDKAHLVWDVQDINQDGDKEILLQTVDNRFVILDKNLAQRAEFPNPFPKDPTACADIVQTGFGKDCRIALHTDTETRYYSYFRLPPLLFVYRFIQRNFALLGLIVACLLAGLIVLVYKRRQVIQFTLDHLQQGVALLSGRDRVRHLNRAFLELLQNEKGETPPGRCRSLSKLLPEVQHALQTFSRGRATKFSATMDLGPQGVRYQVNFYKLRGILNKYLLVFTPPAADPGLVNDKLAWAENAKRLAHNVRRHISDALLALTPLLEDGLPEPQRRNAEIIRDSLDEITTFTRSFQRFTELGQLDLKLQDVIPSVEHCLAKTRIPANVKLIRDWNLGSVETQIEPIRFEEALQNIVNNALDAMPEGGVLHISVRQIPQHEGPQGELSVLVEVEDSGHGIPQKYLEDEIWQLFFTTKEGGTGTGIPTAKKIIESMGGNLLIESEEGRGTVVSIWLKGGENG